MHLEKDKNCFCNNFFSLKIVFLMIAKHFSWFLNKKKKKLLLNFCLIFTLITLFPFSALSAEKIDLFGKKEFKGRIKSLPQWVEVLSKNKNKPVFNSSTKFNSLSWDELKANWSKLSPMEQLKKVNLFWNKYPYRTDQQVYKTPDYWAAPYEFMKNSGDCEDYSIAKYFTLKELGFNVNDMRVAIVMETIRNIAHAVLVVYLNGDAYILDNLSNSVMSHKRLLNYDIQYSVNEKFRWGHVKPKK